MVVCLWKTRHVKLRISWYLQLKIWDLIMEVKFKVLMLTCVIDILSVRSYVDLSLKLLIDHKPFGVEWFDIQVRNG